MQHKMGINRKGDSIYIDGKSKVGEIRNSLLIVYDKVPEAVYTSIVTMYGDLYLVMRLKDYNKREGGI